MLLHFAYGGQFSSGYRNHFVRTKSSEKFSRKHSVFLYNYFYINSFRSSILFEIRKKSLIIS